MGVWPLSTVCDSCKGVSTEAEVLYAQAGEAEVAAAVAAALECAAVACSAAAAGAASAEVAAAAVAVSGAAAAAAAGAVTERWRISAAMNDFFMHAARLEALWIPWSMNPWSQGCIESRALALTLLT